MAEVSLGKLWVRFGIDESELKAGRKRVERELKGMNNSAQKIAAGIGRTVMRAVAPWLALAVAARGVGQAFSAMGQDARALEDLRTQSGLSVRSLYELRQMVNETGGSMQDLTTAVGAYNQAILTASRDSRSEAAQAFRALGVSIHDANGNLTTLEQATAQIAEKFAGWTDGTNKAAIAQTVFGGGATAMTRALNQGAEGVQRAKDEIDKYGRSIDDVHKTQLTWVKRTDELSAALTHFRDKVITPLIPHLVNAVDWFVKLAAKAKELGQTVIETFRTERLTYFSQAVTKANDDLINLMEKQRKISDATGQALQGQESHHADLHRQIQATKERIDDLNAAASQYFNLISRGSFAGNEFTLEQNSGKTTPPRIGGNNTADQQRALAELLAQVDLLRQRLDGLPSSLSYIAEVNTTTYDAMQEKVTQTIDIINAKYKDQENVVRNLHNLKMQLAREEQNTAMDTANVVGSALSSVFAKSKAAAMAETIIHTATAVMRTLRDVPWPYNLVQAAAIAATGAANLAKIRSTTEKGGGGGTASGSAPAAPTTTSGSTVHIQGVDRSHFYSGAVVENLIGSINDAVQNGATLISTRNVPV